MSTDFVPTRGFRETWRLLKGFLRAPDFTHGEKLVCCPLILGRLISLSNLADLWPRMRTERAWSNFLDLYLMVFWPGVLVALLRLHPSIPVEVVLATYQVAMILSNHLAVVLVPPVRNFAMDGQAG